MLLCPWRRDPKVTRFSDDPGYWIYSIVTALCYGVVVPDLVTGDEREIDRRSRFAGVVTRRGTQGREIEVDAYEKPSKSGCRDLFQITSFKSLEQREIVIKTLPQEDHRVSPLLEVILSPSITVPVVSVYRSRIKLFLLQKQGGKRNEGTRPLITAATLEETTVSISAIRPYRYGTDAEGVVALVEKVSNSKSRGGRRWPWFGSALAHLTHCEELEWFGLAQVRADSGLRSVWPEFIDKYGSGQLGQL